MLIHVEGKKPFKCGKCDLDFEIETDLIAHNSKVHEVKKKNFSFDFVTAGTVTRIIKGLKTIKAMGTDEIPTEVLKKGVTVLAGPIARICNISLSTGVFPNTFKEAIVHPVFKGYGKDPRNPASYRPISILPSLSKILEISVPDSLQEWLKYKNFIPDSQFGFDTVSCPTLLAKLNLQVLQVHHSNGLGHT